MVSAVASPASELVSQSRSYARWQLPAWTFLIPPAILLGMLRIWSLWIAPKHDVYFTAEAFLVIYACFAIVRAVHVNAHSHDAQGRFDPVLAWNAKQRFYGQLGRYGTRIAAVVLGLLAGAHVLDVLTAGTGVQYRANVHLSIVFIELMVWARYGAAIVIASAQWTPPEPAQFAKARWTASDASLRIAQSLTAGNIFLCFAGLVAVSLHSRLITMMLFDALPSSRAVFICAAVLCAVLAWLALWLLCRGAFSILSRQREQPRRPAAAAMA